MYSKIEHRFSRCKGRCTIHIEEKAHAGNATQDIHPPLVQDTHTHTCTTAHAASLIHLLVKNTRETYTKQGVPPWHGSSQIVK